MLLKRILIFNVNWLGDVVFSTAVIRNIRRNYPKSFIACVIPLRCEQILKGNPHLDEVIIFDEKNEHKGFFQKLSFIQLLRLKNFDTVFLLHRSFSRTLLCSLAGIKERIGYRTRKRSFLLTKNIPQPEKDSCHRIDYYLNIIEKAGLKVEDRFLEFFFSDEDLNFVDNFLNKNSLQKNDFLAGLNPGANWPLKRWPKEYWAALGDRLIREAKAKVIITGGANDLALVKDIKKLMKEKPIIAHGILNIKQLAALSRRLDLFVTADTGPLHIVNAAGAKKIIALFGPTAPAITGPYPIKNTVILQKDTGCKVPCYNRDCKDNRCMKALTVKEVFEKII
ncbi:MAG: lipopolysaccharide heptosyltransferase II [Candidatus Omnitrophota bacterium]|nr:lipopolysaccharide heptosyltransferase II [Candidatus Omnitrophota bacterium]